MLFLLAMEPLNLLFKRAQDSGLLGKLISVCDMCRISFYADDAALFINPSKDDLIVVDHILSIFAQASGLVTNMGKTQYFPIRCENVDMDFLSSSERVISTFPCLYLGLPLNIRKTTRTSFQYLVQKIGNRLPGWKKGLLSYPDRELLVKYVLSAILTYYLTVFKLPKWALAGINKFRRSFLWKGPDHENVKGGHCLVNWRTYERPRSLEGLESKT
jgi:hypothetical protein